MFKTGKSMDTDTDTDTINSPLKRGSGFQGGAILVSLALLLELVSLTTALSNDSGNKGINGTKRVNFNREIRPILSENCFTCHGPDEKSRMAPLRLDTKAGAFSTSTLNGRPIIVPGKAEESELYRRITSNDELERMPLAISNKKLTPEQIDLLKRWIQEGASWEEHWSFAPPTRPELPTVKNQKWVRNPIDYFILARLEAEGLNPSEELDKRTLIRRLSLDLTGFPPSRQEIKDFLADNSPDAYEKMVDRFLAKPQYGEHMGRFWLDVARYGDTHGLHLDNYREMWPYRDWVIKAFNNDMPFDQFTIEQLAGDLFPNPTLEQRIATGFNRCNVSTSEGGSIDEEYYVRYAVDRISTTATVWMGLTAGCAVCHDHKYDPITQKEFYRMYAFFNNITENAMDGNKKDPNPIVKVPAPEQTAQLAEYDKQIAALNDQLKTPMSAVDEAQIAWETSLPNWTVIEPKTFSSKGGATLKLLEDKSILASDDNPDKEVYEVTAQISEGEFTAIRLEGLKHESLPEKGAGRSKSSNVVLTEFEAELASRDQPETWQPLRFIYAWADYEQSDGETIANATDGKAETGWAVAGNQKREDRQAIFLAQKPFGYANGSLIKIRLKHESENKQHQFGRFRLAVTQAQAFSRIGSPLTLGEWYSAGAFKAYNGTYAFYQKFEPEGKAVNLKQEFKIGPGTYDVLKWTKRDWTDGQVHYDLNGENCATYLYRNIFSATKQKVTLSLGSDDAIQVWVNQKEVFAENIEREATPDQEKVQVELKPGNNELVLKVVNYSGGYGFCFNLESESPIVPANVVDAAKLDREKRSQEQQAATRDYFRKTVSTDPEIKKLLGELANLQRKRTDVDNSIATTLVMEERQEPRGTYVLSRGQYDRRLEQVDAGTPAILSPMPKEAPANRLGFARWLVDPSHPLTARVTVNRFWLQLFGTGIVRTSENFGSQGERPSHPELLDWLATELIHSGWDVKYMLKLIVTSATYRQTSKVSPELLKRDLNNRLLARGPRFRLDAEMMRDQALAVSGLLHPKMGGPSVKPPQPYGLWEAVGYTGSNTVRFVKDSGADKVYRRSLYTFWKRTSPPPQMNIFDAPSREACTARRERTNTPTQALMLMNDPQFFEAARAFAERTIKEGGSTAAQRMAYAFETATARLPKTDEMSILLNTFQAHLEEFKADPEAAKKLIVVGESPPDANLDPVELAAWTMITNLILNLDEVINKG